MGYILILMLGVVLMAVAVIIGTRNKRPKQGRISGEGTAILREQPSADEPNPAQSATASQAEVRNAEKRTPPA